MNLKGCLALMLLQTILQAKKLVTQSKTLIHNHFISNFDITCLFCACANIKQVPGYKETYLGVQLLDSYLDNWLSVPALHIILYT